MKFRPYLYFSGTCQEAVEVYAKAFNTQIGKILRFGDVPSNPNMPPLTEEQKKWIMQTTIGVGDEFIRLSDSLQQQSSGSSLVCIAVEAEIDDIERAFHILEMDGTVMVPLAKTFFSPCYGSVQDKFGVQWQLTAKS